MNYIQVEWKHSFPMEPVLLYSELDDNRWEVRKVEIFSDGHWGYADSAESFGGTRLGKEPLPPLDEIAADMQFSPTEISNEEFEQVWARRNDERMRDRR